MTAMAGVGNGCPPNSRLALCKAFIAKAVWDFPTTRDLIDAVRHHPTLRRLCGWETLKDVPSESTFSRVFAALAEDELPQRIQEAMITEHSGDKIAGHISRDATAIHGREKASQLMTGTATSRNFVWTLPETTVEEVRTRPLPVASAVVASSLLIACTV